MTETWKDIIGFEGLYQISNLGRVKSLAKTWTVGKNRNGVRSKPETIINVFQKGTYFNFSLIKDGQQKTANLHRVIAENFIPNPFGKKEVNHINGNKHDNRIENLEWVSSSENRKHAFDTGLKMSPKGKLHHASVPVVVIFPKEKRTISFVCGSDAGKYLGISKSNISKIMLGRLKRKKDFIIEAV